MESSSERRKRLDHERYMRNREERLAKQHDYYIANRDITANGTEIRKSMKHRIRMRKRPRQMTLDLFRRSAERLKITQRPIAKWDAVEQTLPFEDMDFKLRKKKCPYCGKILPFNMFNLSRKAKDGRQPYCRACQRRYKEVHPDVEYKYKHNNIGTLRIKW